MPRKASVSAPNAAPETEVETAVEQVETPATPATPEIIPAPEFLRQMFVGLAVNQGQMLSKERIPIIAGRGIVAYAAYLGALDDIGVDISEARKAVDTAFRKHNITILTLSDRKAVADAEKAKKQSEVARVEVMKQQKAAEIQARALGVDPNALLTLIDRSRGGSPAPARTSVPATVGADDWSN